MLKFKKVHLGTRSQKATRLITNFNAENTARDLSAKLIPPTYGELLSAYVTSDPRQNTPGRGALKMWFFYKGAGAPKTMDSPVGDDFAAAAVINDIKAFVAYYKAIPSPASNSTIANAASQLRKLAKLWLAMTGATSLTESSVLNISTLPADFSEAFAQIYAIKMTRLGRTRSADKVQFTSACVGAGVRHPSVTFPEWAKGRLPTLSSEVDFEVLEELFEVPIGTLSGRLERTRMLLGRRARPTQKTVFGHVSKAMIDSSEVFPSDKWSDRLKAEWLAYVEYKTSPVLDDLLRSDRGQWSKRRGEERGASEQMNVSTISGFFGYLLSCHKKDFTEADISLGLLVRADLIKGYVEWKQKRRGFNSTGDKVLPVFAASLTREHTGYLTQHEAEFKSTPYANGEAATGWFERCAKTNQMCRKYKKAAERCKKSRTLEPIDNVLIMQHPLQAIFIFQQNYDAMMEHKQSKSLTKREQAILYRDRLLIYMLSCNPLRKKNYEIMTCLGAKPNLYKIGDQWRVRFEADDFKNTKGAQHKPYDVIVAIPDERIITNYLDHRKYLGGAKNSTRLFVGPSAGVLSISGSVTELTRKYLYDYTNGFGPHGFRHIIATDWIKNNPNGFQIAAAVLHDTITTVMKAYAHLEAKDHFDNYWAPYYESNSNDFKRKNSKSVASSSGEKLQVVAKGVK